MSRGRSRACSRHLEISPDLPFWASLRVASDVRASLMLSTKARFQDCSFGALLLFNALDSPFKRAFLLLSPCESRLLGGCMLGVWQYFHLLRAFLTGLPPSLPFLLGSLRMRGKRRNRRGWPVNNWHYGRIPSSMSCQQHQKIKSLLFKHHFFRYVNELMASVTWVVTRG